MKNWYSAYIFALHSRTPPSGTAPSAKAVICIEHWPKCKCIKSGIDMCKQRIVKSFVCVCSWLRPESVISSTCNLVFGSPVSADLEQGGDDGQQGDQGKRHGGCRRGRGGAACILHIGAAAVQCLCFSDMHRVGCQNDIITEKIGISDWTMHTQIISLSQVQASTSSHMHWSWTKAQITSN